MKFRKSFGSGILSVALVTSMVVATPSSSLASTHLLPVSNQLAAAGASLAQASMLTELLPTIDGFGTNPALVLGLHEAFGDLAGLAGEPDLETALNALGGAAGSGFDYSFVSEATDGTVTTVEFTIAANRSFDMPLMVMEDDIQIIGADVTATVTMAPTTVTVEYDSSDSSFALTSLPTFSLNASLTDSVNVPIQFGFADAAAAGTIDLDFTAEATLVDPDGLDRLTGDELSTLAVEDFVSLDFPGELPNDLDLNLALTADVFGTMFGGTLTITDANLFADPVPAIALTSDISNPISNMTNLGPDLAITSLAQLVSGFGVGMIAGDVDLPFLGDGVFIPGNLGQADAADFDQVFDVVAPVMDYVTPRSLGQIVCGTTSIDPDGAGGVDGIPAGSVRNLTGDETVECRAYTSSDGTGVTWTITSGNASFIANNTSADTIGVEPTTNVTIDPDAAAGALAVTVTYTPAGESDPVTIVQRPETIQDLLSELAAANLIPTNGSGDPAFAYDPNIEAFTFDVTASTDLPQRAATINAGNTLIADTGLTGLSAAAGASAHVDLGQVNAAVTLGLIVTDDVATINPADNGVDELAPGPGDRFFLAGSSPLLAVADVDLGGSFAMEGRLGFLEVGATATGSLSKPGGGDALSVSLNYPAGGVQSNGNSIPNAILIRELLRSDVADTVNATVNLAYSGNVAVTSTAPGLSAGGDFDIDWNLSSTKPTISNVSTGFQQTLLPFTSSLQLTQFGAPDADPTVLSIDPSGPIDLLVQAGLVGSQLVDSAGNVCNITAVTSSSQLACSNPDGAVLNPITFTAGTSYDVEGNTLAKLTEILLALDGLIAYLEGALGDSAFNTPIDIVGITPAEIVGQVGELRRMVDEFRGVQDAQTTCTVQGAGDADVRAIPVPDSGDITLLCSAVAATDSASNVQWRVSSPDVGGTFQAGDDTTVGASSAVTTVSLTVPAAYDVSGDGYVSIGSEYRVEVEWTDSEGDHQAAFPPRVPQSLQGLAELITEILELPDGLLEFDLVDIGGVQSLRINLAYGICSDTAPSFDGPDDPCAGRPTGPTPTANLNLDLGSSLPDFVGLDTTGALDVRYAALGTFDVGVPLDGSEPVLYGSTGLDARIEVNGTGVGFNASIGPAEAKLGAAAVGPNGEADADSTTTLTDAAVDLTAFGVGSIVHNTTDDTTCFVTAVTDADNVECALDWNEDDVYTSGGAAEFQAALQLAIQLTDTFNAGAVVPDGDFVTFTKAGVDITDVAGFLSGGADCGSIDESLMDEILAGSGSPADGNLTGIACARLSLALMIGSDAVYLGELALELDGTGLGLWVPDNLVDRLGDALLNPAFLIQALPDILEYLEEGMRDAADGIPAAVGDPLRTGADGLEAVRGTVEAGIDAFETALGDAGITNVGELETAIETQLDSIIGTGLLQSIEVVTLCDAVAETECGDGDGFTGIEDIRAVLTFGQMEEASTGVNLGLEGLPLSIEAGVGGFASWSITFGIGVSLEDGPYVALRDPADGPELEVSAGANLANGPTDCAGPMANSVDPTHYTTDRCVRGQLAFLFLTAIDATDATDDGPSEISATLGLDVTSGSADKITFGDLAAGDVGVDPVLEGGVHIDLHFRTGIGDDSPDLPTLLGTFALDWNLALGDPISAPTIAFDNLHLDLGTFFNEFLSPITSEIKKITGPLQPIIDVITAPIPVVSDLAELVGGDPITMISILEAATDSDLSLVEAVAAFISFINGIPENADFQIALGDVAGAAREAGSFKVNAEKAGSKLSPTEAGSLIDQDPTTYKGGSGFAGDVAAEGGLSTSKMVGDRPATFGVPGLSFPFLEDASQVFGILVGRDAVLIRWDAGTLRATAGMSYDFGPIMVGPVPITITIGGEIGIEGRFAIGYDTSGIRKLLDGGSGTALFDGIFIDDLDAQGNDVPEIKFFGRVFAGASVDLVIVSAGVRGGIELTFALDLDDRPDQDGKLRIEEIVDKLANPICLFVVSGKIEAFLEAFVEIDLFFFSKEYSFELVRITLLEWSSACEPPEPVLSEKSGDVLVLNIGDRRDRRNIQEDVTDEVIEVRQIGANKVRQRGPHRGGRRLRRRRDPLPARQ